MYKESYKRFQKRFISNLTKELKNSGLSQRQQTLSGLDPRHISRIKKGDKNITLKTIWKICKTGKFDPIKLFEKIS